MASEYDSLLSDPETPQPGHSISAGSGNPAVNEYDALLPESLTAAQTTPDFTPFEKIMAPLGAGFANAPKSAMQMVDYINHWFYKPVDAVLGTKLSEGYARQLSDRAVEISNNVQVAAEAGGPTWGPLAATLTEQVSMLPVQLVTGGVAAMANGVKAAITASAVFGGLQSASSSFSNNVAARVESGETVEEASRAELLPSVSSGLITGAITKGFGATGIESIFAKGGGRGLTNKLRDTLIKGGFGEMKEEVSDEAAQIINDLVNNKKVTPAEALKRVGTAAVVAGILGTGVAGLHNAMQPNAAADIALVQKTAAVAPKTAEVLKTILEKTPSAEPPITEVTVPVEAVEQQQARQKDWERRNEESRKQQNVDAMAQSLYDDALKTIDAAPGVGPRDMRAEVLLSRDKRVAQTATGDRTVLAAYARAHEMATQLVEGNHGILAPENRPSRYTPPPVESELISPAAAPAAPAAAAPTPEVTPEATPPVSERPAAITARLVELEKSFGPRNERVTLPEESELLAEQAGIPSALYAPDEAPGSLGKTAADLELDMAVGADGRPMFTPKAGGSTFVTEANATPEQLTAKYEAVKQRMAQKATPEQQKMLDAIAERKAGTTKTAPKNDITVASDAFNKAAGRPPVVHADLEVVKNVDAIADASAAMKHDPTNPEVAASYAALVQDIKDQWKYATEVLGIKIEATDADPYSFTAGGKPAEQQLFEDVKNNKRLGVFRGGNELLPGHPLAEIDPGTGESYNTMFRAIHDVFGHTAGEHTFDEKGEMSAWGRHKQMMSPEAVAAMTTETLGQTSWYFHNAEVRAGKAEPGAFAEQKAGIIPGFSQGVEDTTVNVGKFIGLNGERGKLTTDRIIAALKATGVRVLQQSDHEGGTEPTVVATLNRPLTPDEGKRVADVLQQESIAQYADGVGKTYGAQADAWTFDPKFFKKHDGTTLDNAGATAVTSEGGPTAQTKTPDSRAGASADVEGLGEGALGQIPSLTGAEANAKVRAIRLAVSAKLIPDGGRLTDVLETIGQESTDPLVTGFVQLLKRFDLRTEIGGSETIKQRGNTYRGMWQPEIVGADGKPVDAVVIRKDASATPEDLHNLVMHEAVHAGIAHIIKHPTTPRAKAFVSELERLQKLVSKHPDAAKFKYALAGSLQEMHSSIFDNREFFNFLNSVSDVKKPSDTILGSIKNAIARFMGIEPNTAMRSMFDAIYDLDNADRAASEAVAHGTTTAPALQEPPFAPSSSEQRLTEKVTGKFSKALIMPDGTVTRVQSHDTWLRQNTKINPMLEVQGIRVEGLNQGYGRVNYEVNGGRVTLEVNEAAWPKMKNSFVEMVNENADGIDNITVNILNNKGESVRSDSANVSQLDDADKAARIPFTDAAEGGGMAESMLRRAGLDGRALFAPEQSEELPVNEQGPAVENWINKAVKATGRVLQKQFTAEGNLPKPVFENWQKRQGEVKAIGRDIKYTTRDLYAGIQQAYEISGTEKFVKGFANLPAGVAEQMNAALLGEVEISSLPEQVRGPLVEMRAQIDQLSQMLIDEGVIGGDLAVKIGDNMGTYMTRSYEAFDNPNWPEKVPVEVRNRAQAFILGELRVDNPEATAEDANRKIDSMLQDWKEQGDSRGKRGGKVGSRDLSSFIKRQDITPVIRELLGEWRDPVVNYTRSMTKMAGLLSDTRFLRNVLRQGKTDGFLFEDGKQSKGFNALIAAEGSEPMAPLNGLRTTPEIAEAFKIFGKAAARSENWAAKLWFRAVATAKLSKTVGSLMTQVRNAGGQVFFMAMAGHSNFSSLGAAIKATGADTGLFTDTAAWRGEYQRLVKLGVVDQSVHSDVLRLVLKEAALTPTEQGLAKGGGVLTAGGTLDKNIYKATVGAAIRAYQISDDAGKIVGWYNEAARQKKIHPEWTTEQVETEAARRIQLTYPTYARLPNVVTAMRNWPIGPFAAFAWEAQRTSYHNIRFMMEDLASASPAAKRAGAARLAGQLAVLSGGLAASAASRALLGMSDDEEKDARLFLAPWDRNAQLIFTGKEPGKLSFLNLSFINPFSFSGDTINAAARGLDEDGIVKMVIESSGQLMKPFYDPDIWGAAVLEVITNKKKSGAPVYNSTDDLDRQMRDRLTHLWGALEPGTLTRVRTRIIPATQGKTLYGEQLTPSTEIMKELLGGKTQTLNFEQAVGYKASDFARDEKGAQNIFRTAALQDGSTDDEIIEAYARSEKARFIVWKTAHKAAMAAIRSGISSVKLREILSARGMGKADVSDVIRGKYQPNVPSDDMKKVLRKKGRKLPKLQSPFGKKSLADPEEESE